MDPALALPSYRVYRGSLLALLVGSIVAVWLLVLPPASADQDGPPDSIADLVNTATAVATGTAEGEATVPADGTPGEGEASPSATPEETETPSPSPTPTPTPEEQRYIVEPGDTMFLIADQYAPEGTAPTEFANAIAAANGITDLSSLQVGQELIIPAQ